MREIRVSLGHRSYPILIGSNLLGSLGAECTKHKLGARCAIISDVQVSRRYAKACWKSLEAEGFEPVLITVPAGETAKKLAMAQSCYNQLAAHRLERKSFIVALGGGVIGDLAGFVAATYLRGVDFVQVPTTLLAQVDSSVGGKVGVNLPAGKNLVGAFHQPRLVVCDLGTLDTLPQREFRAGLAEVIKYGIIYDRAFFEKLEQHLPRLLRRDLELMGEVVARCCEIKAEVVGQDETESGLRSILNFGHTIGHAVEAVSGYGKLLHGEAISIGQVLAARLSNILLDCPEEEVERIRALLKLAGLPTTLKLTPRQRERLLQAMKMDKKISNGVIRFVLARKIGQVVYGREVPEAMVNQLLATSALEAKG